jgi:hypothetical protein
MLWMNIHAIHNLTPRRLLPIGALLLLLVSSCSRNPSPPPPTGQLPPEIAAFAAAKEKHARQLAERLKLKLAPDIWAFFAAAKTGQTAEALRIQSALRRRAGQYEGSTSDPAVATPVWGPVLETTLALEAFAPGHPKYALVSGRDIIASIPPGSIYFGGTDPGRGLVTALCKSHQQADPFFTLTQNALADGNYLEYLRQTYGGRIGLLSSDDSQRAFAEYLADAQLRLEHHQLKPGEQVQNIDGKVQVSGQVAVMAINARLAKIIFDKNPDRQFFIEESFPLDWMYPYLTPHGLILQINRQPLATISDETIKQDQTYWNERIRQMLGDWLHPDTSVEKVCDFAEAVYLQQDLSAFKGDPEYVSSDYACKFYSKLRSAIAGVYAWRCQETKDSAEKQRLLQAADFALRQAFALCPTCAEAVFRYVNLLTQQNRFDDALRVARLAAEADSQNGALAKLVRDLQNKAKDKAPTP